MEVLVASVVRRLASRVRRGVSRRVNGVLERVGVRASAQPPHPASTAEPRPSSASKLGVGGPLPLAVPASTAEPRPLRVEVVASSVPDPEPTPAPAPDPAADTGGPPLLTREQVEVLFEEMVRPALQSDGGDITLVRVQDNDVFVELVGACHTCPSSVITMHDGIERLLREEFPHFGRLVRVDGAG